MVSAAELATLGDISAVVEAARPGEPGPPVPNSPVEYSCPSLTNTDTLHMFTHFPYVFSLTHYLAACRPVGSHLGSPYIVFYKYVYNYLYYCPLFLYVNLIAVSFPFVLENFLKYLL